MRHVVAFVVIVFACILVPARSAEAQGGLMEWLERLSGPGHFEGLTVPVKFLCYGLHKTSSVEADPFFATAEARQKALDAQEFRFQVGCGRTARNLVRMDIGFEASWMFGDNTLTYDPSVSPDDSDTVNAQIYAGTFDVGVHRAIDVGFAVGVMRFSNLPVNAFNRMFLQVGRITWKPLAMFRASTPGGRYQQEFLQVRFIGRWMPDGFKAEDFGAIPGTFESGPEIQSGVSVGVDLFALFKVR
jgi:hypothetical protein